MFLKSFFLNEFSGHYIIGFTYELMPVRYRKALPVDSVEHSTNRPYLILISRKRCEIGCKLLLYTNRKSHTRHMIFRKAYFDIFNRLGVTHECDRRKDGRTDISITNDSKRQLFT